MLKQEAGDSLHSTSSSQTSLASSPWRDAAPLCVLATAPACLVMQESSHDDCYFITLPHWGVGRGLLQSFPLLISLPMADQEDAVSEAETGLVTSPLRTCVFLAHQALHTALRCLLGPNILNGCPWPTQVPPLGPAHVSTPFSPPLDGAHARLQTSAQRTLSPNNLHAPFSLLWLKLLQPSGRHRPHCPAPQRGAHFS